LLHRPDIGVEPELALGGSRVLPADGEGLQIAVQGESNNAFFRHQIEDVKFVDLRRSDQERPLVHLRSQRPVLDQLHDRIAIDH
jgi:hypothetical protein